MATYRIPVRSWCGEHPIRNPQFCLLTALLCFLFFFRLGSVPLFDLDEGLYVTCARQMATSGDLITPRLNTRLPDRPGEAAIPFYEKPILVYWLAAGAIRLFGPNELAARLPVALAALLTTWAVLLAGARWFGRRAGMLAALVYATSPLTVVDARELTPDGLLVLWFTGILLTFQAIRRNAAEPERALGLRTALPVALFWGLCALAVLTKGIIGLLLPILIIVISLVLDHLALRFRLRGVRRPFVRFALRLRAASEWRPAVRALRPLAGLALFLALTVPWFVLIWRAGGRDELGHTFVQEYIIRQHIGRFKGQDAVHNLPLPSYLIFFLIGFFPWSCMAPAAFRYRIRREAEETEAEETEAEETEEGQLAPDAPARQAADRESYRYLLIWFWTVCVFFTLAAAKLPAYIAPAYPAAALLVGRWLDRILAAGLPQPAVRSLRRAAAGATITGGLLLAAALVGPRFAPADAPIPDDVKRVALHLTLLLAGGSALAWAGLRFGGAPARSVRAGIGVQAALLTLLVGVGCTEGYAVASRDVLLPYQRAAMAAAGDAARGVPVVFYNIIPRRPSMLYYAQYSPYEHKEPGLLAFLKSLPTSSAQVDVVTSRASYERVLRPELDTVPAMKCSVVAQYGDGRGGWLLVRLISVAQTTGTMR